MFCQDWGLSVSPFEKLAYPGVLQTNQMKYDELLTTYFADLFELFIVVDFGNWFLR